MSEVRPDGQYMLWDGINWNILNGEDGAPGAPGLPGSPGGITDHGDLTGLTDDDHTMYAKADGSRGNFEAQGAVATHNADTAAHSALRGTATPIATDTMAPQVGTSTKYAREDHKHQLPVGTPVSLGEGNATGVSNSLARADHIHAYPSAANVGAVAKVGDEMSGSLTIKPAAGSALFYLKKAAAGSVTAIYGMTGNLNRWIMALGNGTPETGMTSGSDFSLDAFDDDGTSRNPVLTFLRSTKLGTVRGDPVDPLGIATKHYVDVLGLAGKRIEASSRVAITDANGIANFNFLFPFQSMPAVVVSHGDANGALGPISVVDAPTATSMKVKGGWGAGLAVRVNYNATGPAVPSLLKENGEPVPLVIVHSDPDPAQDEL
jgi:hypothetical protein